MRYTKKDFEAEYPDDDACLEAVFQNRFGDLKFCPKCGAETNFYKVKKRQCYACQWCAYQLHPLADTIFRKTTTPLKDWFYAIYLFSVSKNGVSAKELERHLGVTYKTAWRMCKQIRLLMKQDTELLGGTVEMDETYVGGRKRGIRGRGAKGKESVIGIAERHGRVKAQVTKDVSNTTMVSLINQNTTKGVLINTDDFRAYAPLKRMGFNHVTIKHSQKIWVQGDVHTNTIENFWGQFKNSIRGTYHYVSPKYLQSYVDEFVFRRNLRDVAVCPVLLELASKRV